MSGKWTPQQWVREGLTVYALDQVAGRYHKGQPMMANRMYCQIQTSACLASSEEMEANACLIAAAPELYEALAEFMAMWGSGDTDSPSKRAQARRAAMWNKANAAVAKARGVA